MELMEFFDNIPLPIYLLIAILAMILLIETGYRGGLYSRRKPDKAQMAQVRAIMGASLVDAMTESLGDKVMTKQVKKAYAVFGFDAQAIRAQNRETGCSLVR